MAKHIHIYLPAKTHDAVKHAPAGTSKGGQFVSGSGGGGGGSGAPSKKVNASSGPDEDKLRARVKAAREGMQAAGKNKAEYERHESQFEESTNALLKHQEKSKTSPAKKTEQAPSQIKHKGATYSQSGKTGTHAASGEASAEYEEYDDKGKRTGARVWRTASGKVYED